MATVTIYGDSPEAPSPMKLMSWQESLDGLYGAGNVNRTSADGEAYTTYDINGAPTEAEILGVVGEYMHVTVA